MTRECRTTFVGAIDGFAAPRNDGEVQPAVRSNNCRISVVIRPFGDIISCRIVK